MDVPLSGFAVFFRARRAEDVQQLLAELIRIDGLKLTVVRE
jgi:hypothetical protein